MSYNAVCSRIVTIRIKVRPAIMSIIQMYAPTLDKDEEVHDEFYEQLQVVIAISCCISNGGEIKDD